MSLAHLLYPAPTPQGMEEWFFQHHQHHLAILGAMKANKGIELDSFPLYPVNVQQLQTWLETHQQMHNAMTEALGISGFDLSGLDLKDKAKSDNWFFQHYLQHQSVGEVCGSPI